MAAVTEPLAFALRAAVARDVPAIAAIYADAVLYGTASFEMVPPGAEEMAQRQERLLAGGFPYLVATDDSDVLGFAYAGPYRARPAYAHTVESSVYVRAGRQRRGIGLALLQRLILEAQERRFRQMVAVIGDSGNKASIRLHERLGFIHAGTLRAVGWKHDRWLDTVLMQRSLAPGAAAPPESHGKDGAG
jgi:L-amino acid N-acyltransferase YncA